jgi:acyl-CoA thioesterase FadM
MKQSISGTGRGAARHENQSQGTARFSTRYEDLSQDGHIKLTVLAAALGRACFAQVWANHPLSSVHKQGVVPILGRLVLEGEALSVRSHGALEGRGRLDLAHEPGDDGSVRALCLNAYADVWATPKRTARAGAGQQGAAVSDDAPNLIRIGRAFGEHIFTRPFAAKGERKVLRFDVPEYPAVPTQVYKRTPLASTLALPATARALAPEFLADAAPWVFGLTHTDGNQHVNSLVYVRMFEDAALRHLAVLGRDVRVLARRIEVQYRKPCFAGEQLTCMLRAYADAKSDGVVAYVGPEGAPPEQAHCAARVTFSAAEATSA